MNQLKYENTHYEDALNYVEQYSKTKDDGYYKLDLVGKSEQVQVQQNNTIIALLSSLHYRITQIETKLIKLEGHIGQSENNSTTWKTTLQSITKDLEKISVGKTVKHRPQTYSFLTYTETQNTNTPPSTSK